MYPAMHSWSFRNRFKQDPSFDARRMLDETARMGLTSIEVMSGKAGSEGGDFGTADIGRLKEIKTYADQAGVTIHCLSTYNDFAFVTDEQWRLENIAYIKDWLRIAADMQVPNIRMLTGYYIEGQDPARLEQLTLEGIGQCVPVAEECGVNMAVENHNSIFFTAEAMLELMRQVGSDRLTACPDPSNWGGKAFFEGDPEAKAKVLANLRAIADKATNSHMKIKGIDAEGKIIGFGDDLDTVIEIYRDAGYDGPIHFEAVGKAEDDLLAPLSDAARLVREAIDRVCGK
jgi:sugar phosphate isomerase/epimerase